MKACQLQATASRAGEEEGEAVGHVRAGLLAQHLDLAYVVAGLAFANAFGVTGR